METNTLRTASTTSSVSGVSPNVHDFKSQAPKTQLFSGGIFQGRLDLGAVVITLFAPASG